MLRDYVSNVCQDTVSNQSQGEYLVNLSKINSSTLAIMVAAIIILATGFYAQNGGFKLAGFLIHLVGCVLSFNQASDRKDD